MKMHMKMTLFILMAGAIVLSACSTQLQTQQIPEGAKFQFDIYGNNETPQAQSTLLMIDSSRILYATYTSDGKVTQEYSKNISAADYAALVQYFNDKNFLEMNDKYSPPQTTNTDIGNAKMTVSWDNTSKSVVLEPYYLQYYPDNVKLAAEKLQSFIDNLYTIPQDELESIAEDWIIHAPTYSYDGKNLEFKSVQQLNTQPPAYVLAYTFESGGYGNRSRNMNAQPLKTHEIRLAITEGKVVAAVIDNVWNEMTQSPYEVKIAYQPLQCSDIPWRKWYDDGNIQFINKPSEEELVIAYYGQMYNITVQNFTFYSNPGTIESVCGNPEPWHYTAIVSGADFPKMVQLGWNVTSQN